MKFKPVRILALVSSLLLLTSCIPSGNIVGNAQFTTIESNFADSGDVSYLELNGGTVITPNGVRVRLNKANFSIPSKGIFLTASRLNDVDPTKIPKSVIMDSRMKGKNNCGYATGVFNDGQTFGVIIFADPLTDARFVFLQASGGGIYLGALSGGKVQIGGRNLCG